MNKKNIAIAGASNFGRALARHVVSRSQFEETFPFKLMSYYDPKCSTHPDVKNLNAAEKIEDLTSAENIDIIVDTQNNVKSSYQVVWEALNAGKHAVTNNATMVAIHGEKLSKIASANNVHFKFSAAVLGGVPVVQSLQTGCESWYISRVHGVLNSACNYVLKRMKERHIEQKEALSAAIELGYANPNPDMDVSGKDTLYKLALLSAVSYGVWPNLNNAHVTSLDEVSLPDVKLANQLGFNIRHIGRATRDNLTIGPVLMEENTLMGRMDGTLTGVVVDGDQVGSVFMAGYGADEHATVSSLMSDIFSCIRQRPEVSIQRTVQNREHAMRVTPRYYVRLPSEAKAPIEQAKLVDIIEESVTQTKQGESLTGLVVETNMAREDLSALLAEHKDQTIILDIFRE